MSELAKSLQPFLGNLDHLTDRSVGGKGEYIHPALRNLGCVTIVFIRELIAPAVFRGQEPEITEIVLESTGQSYVRAVPNKFKHRDRANGLKILRHYRVGGTYPQNRHAIAPKAKLSEAFDMNSLVFGDSANQGDRVLSVKAAVLYSDGLSLVSYLDAVGSTFHNRASEDGSLFDPETKENSNNLFSRHFVKPGTLMVQVVSMLGKTLPIEGLNHLLLSVGLAGAYGGQTSVTGLNVQTHIAGIYGSLVERPETSPYNIVKAIGQHTKLDEAATAIHDFLSKSQSVAFARTDAEAYRDELIRRLEKGDETLKASYMTAHEKIGGLFSDWFSGKVA